MTLRHPHAGESGPEQPLDFGLFAPAPSAPGSRSSEDAADAMTFGKVQREERRVLTWFAAQSEARTRHDCAEVLYQGVGGIGPACGRINSLITVGYLEEVGRDGKRATIRITSKGRAKFAAMERAA